MKSQSIIRRLLAFTDGAAAVEMALITPVLAILMAGSAELGRYFYQEHVLTKGVRDAAIYASRSDITKFHCDTGAVDAPIPANARALVRTGDLSGGSDLLPWWTATSGVVFNVSVSCVTAAGGTTLGGIYTANGGKVPVLTINATLPYQTMMSAAGFPGGNWHLNASEQAVVQGI